MPEEWALSLYVPWIWAILYGGKRHENRTWKLGERHIGRRIWLHASLGNGPRQMETERQAMIEMAALDPKTIGAIASPNVPSPSLEWCLAARGLILGSVVVTAVEIHSVSPWFVGPYGFKLSDPVALARPVPARGKQMPWRVPADVLEKLREPTCGLRP